MAIESSQLFKIMAKAKSKEEKSPAQPAAAASGGENSGSERLNVLSENCQHEIWRRRLAGGIQPAAAAALENIIGAEIMALAAARSSASENQQ
jgi:hypothetical protein